MIFLAFPFAIALAAVAIIIVYDVLLYRWYGVDATISMVMWKLGCRIPLVPAVIGFFVGAAVGGLFVHFWAYQP